ncbi:MAG: multidrug effflux MFS transporter [Pseudomonadota bacterium]
MQTRPSTWQFILYMTSMAVIAQFASDNFLPSLPAISEYFNISKNMTQYSVSLYLFGMGVFQFLYGPLSDVYGRKRVLVSGYVVFTVGSIFCFCAPTITWLLVGRVIQGAGIACTGLFRSVMRDSYNGTALAKLGSIVTIAASMTPPLAPITGGYLEHFFGWRASFILLFVMGLTSVLVFSRYFPESLPAENRRVFSIKGIIKNYFECFSHRNFVIFSMCSGLCLGIIFGYMTIGTFLYQHVLGLSPVAYGWLAIFGMFFMPMGAFFNRRFMDRFSLYQLTVFAAFMMLLGSVVMLMFALFHIMNIAVILAPTFIIYFGIGFVFPNAFTQAFDDFGHIAGVAGAAYGAIQVFTSSITTTLAAILPTNTQMPLALYCIACSGVMLLILTRVKKIKEV